MHDQISQYQRLSFCRWIKSTLSVMKKRCQRPNIVGCSRLQDSRENGSRKKGRKAAWGLGRKGALFLLIAYFFRSSTLTENLPQAIIIVQRIYGCRSNQSKAWGFRTYHAQQTFLACRFCFPIADHVMLPQRIASFKCRPMHVHNLLKDKRLLDHSRKYHNIP